MADSAEFPGFQGAYFGFELDGLQVGYFTSVDGLSAEIGVGEYQALGDGNRINAKIPGQITFPQVTLARGLTTDKSLQEWVDKMQEGSTERKTGSIVIYDRDKQERARFNMEQAYPSKLETSGFDASSGGQAVIETLTIQHELLVWSS